MSLITEKLEELSRQYAADVAALKAVVKEIEDHEVLGADFGYMPVVSVSIGSVRVWLHGAEALVEDGAELTKPVQFICNKPVYRFTYEGRTVNVLGE